MIQYGAPYNFGGVISIPSAVSEATNEFRIFVGGTPSAKTSVDLSMYFANADYHVQNPNDLTGNTYVDERYSYAAPRLGFVWRPTAAVAVRAAAGGGFAEAPLDDLVGTNAPFCFGGTCTVTVPNLNLQPEKSFGFDLGMDIRLHHDTTLSMDVYRSNLYGQFYSSTTLTGTYLGSPLYTTQDGNLGESRYEGILLDLRHDPSHGIYWALSGGLTRGYVVSLPAGFYNAPGTTCNVATNIGCTNQSVVPSVNFNGTFTGVSVPYSQGLGTFGYRWNAEKYADLVGTYFGNNNTYFRPAFVELDGNVSYPLSKNASLLMTFRNITGIYDGSIGVFTSGNFIGVPTVSGLPYALYGQQYGPRTIILTTIMHL
jgi:outer membrane receptor protein involved in Fe transport